MIIQLKEINHKTMKEYLKSILSSSPDSASVKRVIALSITYALIIALYIALGYFIFTHKMLSVPDNLVTALYILGGASITGTAIEKFTGGTNKDTQ